MPEKERRKSSAPPRWGAVIRKAPLRNSLKEQINNTTGRKKALSPISRNRLSDV
jgi:hypothetical protein